MKIVIGGTKGGTGKSTTAINLATYLVNKKKDVILIDTDKRESVTRWVQDRAEDNKLALVNSAQLTKKVNQQMHDFGKKYEYVIVDTPGRDCQELRTAMLAADILLIPINPTQLVLDSMVDNLNIYIQSLDYNEKLNALTFLNTCHTNPRVKDREEATAFLSDFSKFKLLKTPIFYRKVYSDIISEGKGITEADNSKYSVAINEFIHLAKEVLKWQ